MTAHFDDGLVPLDQIDESNPNAEPWPIISARTWTDLFVIFVVLAIWWAAAFKVAVPSFISAPVSDTHAWMARLFEAEGARHPLGYLWLAHNNQRIVWSRALVFWDIDLAKGRGLSAFLISSMVIQGCVAIGAAKLVVLSLKPSLWRPLLAILVGVVLMDAAFIEDADLTNFAVYIQAAGFSAMALMAFALRGPGWRMAMTPLALGLGVLAMFGNAAGLAVWPVLLISALRSRSHRAMLLTILIFGAVVILLASAGLGAPTGTEGAPSSGVAHLLKMVSFFCGYVALPWASSPKLVMRIAGGALAALYLWMLMRGPDRDGGGVLRRAGLDLMTFALVTAALAALGRVDEMAEPFVPVRYAPLAMLGQAGLLLAISEPLIAWANRQRWAAATALVATMVLAILNQSIGFKAATKNSDIIRSASEAFDRGDRSANTVRLIYPDPPVAEAVRAELKRRGLPN